MIELLVVVAIIALLISIILPSLNAARDRARFIKCATNLKTLITTTMIYTDENKDYMPPANWASMDKQEGWLYSGSSKTFAKKLQLRRDDRDEGRLWPYIKEDAIYRCPSQVIDETYPHAGRYSWLLTSYLMNGATVDYGEGGGAVYKRSRFRTDAVLYWEPPWLEKWYDEEIGWNDGSSFPDERFTSRHGGDATVVHIDGHMSTYIERRWEKDLSFAPSPLWCAPGTDNGAPSYWTPPD